MPQYQPYLKTSSPVRVRKSFREIEKAHYLAIKNGEDGPTELDTLVDAWAGIQAKPPTDLNSFFMVAGYHGEPFRGAGWGNGQWWGGYCYHGQMLFPTWHRAYVVRLENALRSIPGCENVSLPFWDECEPESLSNGIPDTFGQRYFQKSDGSTVRNPLFSYIFNGSVYDNVAPFTLKDPTNYTKLAGYETVRYPLSGLVGTDKDREETTTHNMKYPDDVTNFSILNENVRNWLVDQQIVNHEGTEIKGGVRDRYRACLDAPYFTIFSNTTSATAWEQDFYDPHGGAGSGSGTTAHTVVPVESPHNSMHLAIGGFETPKGGSNNNPIAGANGDMGENDTAAFDPIFFFHHCFIDRMFWLWQWKHGQQTKLIHEERFNRYPGTNTADSQGPTPGTAANTWLTLDTPLDPFTKIVEGGKIIAVSTVGPGEPITSQDVANTLDLGYTYAPGSFDDIVFPPASDPRGVPSVGAEPTNGHVAKKAPVKTLRVAGINRGEISGSFIVSTWARDAGGAEKLVGYDAILSRHRTQGCMNCQTHLGVKTFVPLDGLEDPDEAQYIVRLHTRDDPGGLKLPRQVDKQLGVLMPLQPSLDAFRWPEAYVDTNFRARI